MANTKSDRRQPPPGYLGRGQQLRLLMLVMSLGVILLAMRSAAQPENWYWLWGGRPPTNEAAVQGSPATAPNTTAPKTTVASTTAPLEWLVDDPLREQLAEVEDDQPFRAGEHEVFYDLLARLAEVGPQAINNSAVPDVSFVQLAAQPAEYRGKWVRFRGTVRGLKTIEASANEYGIERLYQLWVQHDDDRRSVLAVYCTELPDGFPGGATTNDAMMGDATEQDATKQDATKQDAPAEIDDLRELVTITGISLKRWPYQAQDGMRTAPLVLTASPAWSPTQAVPVAARGSTLPSPLTMGVVLVSAVVIALLIVFRGSRRTPSTQRADAGAPGGVVHGMKLADTNPNHITAMRDRDEADRVD